LNGDTTIGGSVNKERIRMTGINDVSNANENTTIRRNLENLLTSPEGLEFCASRNISIAAVRAFQLGIETRRISMLRDRLLFPIFDQYGEFIAYQGRAIYPDMEPKYWFQPFDKSRVLYGLSLNIPLIVSAGYCAVVEGNIDVITLWQLGVPAVAYMGSLMSETQALLLRRYTENVLVIQDNDKTGHEMLPRLIERLESCDFGVDVFEYDDHKDVSEYYGEEPWKLTKKLDLWTLTN
jgi:DNA primase